MQASRRTTKVQLFRDRNYIAEKPRLSEVLSDCWRIHLASRYTTGGLERLFRINLMPPFALTVPNAERTDSSKRVDVQSFVVRSTTAGRMRFRSMKLSGLRFDQSSAVPLRKRCTFSPPSVFDRCSVRLINDNNLDRFVVRLQLES